MGLIKLFSEDKTSSPNPNPNVFEIQSIREVSSYCIAEIKYPGCTTHKGIKILVFDASMREIKNRARIDPHFLDNDNSLIARFPATEEGRHNALIFVRSKIGDDYARYTY